MQQDHHTQSIDRSAPEAASAWTKALAQIRRYKLEETFGPILRLRPQRLDRKGRLVLRGSREALDGIVQAGLVPRLKKLVTHYGIAAGVVSHGRGTRRLKSRAEAAEQAASPQDYGRAAIRRRHAKRRDWIASRRRRVSRRASR